MSEVEGGFGAEKRLAQYILDSDSEREAYQEFIKEGGNPRETIWYTALGIIGEEDEVATDIEEYEKQKPITQAEYRKNSGCICPVCRGKDVTGESPEVDGSAIWANVSCEDCGAYWTDYYKLAGYDNLEKGNNVITT